MGEVEIRHGMFSWTDLAVPDPDAVKPFYRELFGWTTHDVPMGGMGTYTLFNRGEQEVGGLSSQPPGQKRPGPPMWNSYVSVDDVDSVTAKVEDLGGTVIMSPMDVGEEGRMSILQDPTGGVMSLWQSRKPAASAIYNEPGTMTWNELATRDAEAAMAFYGGLLGWTFEPMETVGGPYQIIKNGDRPSGGVMQMTDEWPPELPSHWMVYFAVEDVETSAKKVEELGGKICVPPMDIQVGMFSVVEDPQGGTFTIFRQSDEGESGGS